MIFLVIPFLLAELILSLKIVEQIGALWSVVWILGTMMFGISLLRNSEYTIMGNIQYVSKGKLDLQSFQNANMAYIFGALLLLIPGVLSDSVGVMLLLYTIYLRFVAKVTPEKTNFNPKGDDNVIDVEIVDEFTSSNRHS